ncbi:hypothetical protein [Sphingobacterium sp. DR205]|uniref:hypothetical protein n=1 Tax=Sphingobacterium sp. DR205 TaxID=2713573 RepID=UPI0013E496A4|nr:hypothetical protein [Sphingobacterium sp. DR205]QIH32494.1 hypothetical protein G6053_06145 [Sphingobacterium sp. DR205]
MNTDFNFIPESFEDEEDKMDYLFGHLRWLYGQHSLVEWKKKIEELVQVISNNYCEAHLVEKDFSPFVSEIKKIIEEAWCVLQKSNRMEFKHEYLGIEWKPNPYALKKKNISEHHQYRTSFKRQFQNKITLINEYECRDFFLVFDDFFNQLDVINWLKLMDKWAEFSLGGKGLISECYDYTPHQTSHHLQRLFEACYLMDDFVFCPGFYPPNSQLFHIDYMMLNCYSETYDGYNPFLLLAYLFTGYELSELKNSFSYWMYCAKNQTEIYSKDEPGTLLGLYKSIGELLEIGWLILHTLDMPEHWLDPARMDSDFDITKVNIKEEVLTFLSREEQRNLRKSLHNFYKANSWFHYQRMTLEDALYYALQTKHQYYNIEHFEKLESNINKLMEILYALNREFMNSKLVEEK